MAAITLDPIGRVHSPRIEAEDDFWGNVISVIELDGARFTSESVLGLTDFSHLVVIIHLDRVADASVVSGASHPRGNPEWPRVRISRNGRNTGPTS